MELGKDAKLYVTERLMTDGEQKAESNIEVQLNGEDSSAQIVSRSVGKGNSVQTFHPNAIGNSKCQAHIQCDSIIMDHAEVGSIPEIRAKNIDAAIIHEAAIGRINDEQLLKLRTLGLTEEEAEEVKKQVAAEADRLAEIEAICFPPAEAASHEEVVKRMGAFPENFVVAVKNDQIVGFINGGTTDKPVLPDEFYHDITLHKKDGEIQTVFGLNVIPEYRHQGIAGELVEYFKNLAKERGKKALILTCKEHMIPFYESHGLKKLGVADSCQGGATWYDMHIWF